jgi:hypothetical protein
VSSASGVSRVAPVGEWLATASSKGCGLEGRANGVGWHVGMGCELRELRAMARTMLVQGVCPGGMWGTGHPPGGKTGFWVPSYPGVSKVECVRVRVQKIFPKFYYNTPGLQSKIMRACARCV